MIPKTTPHKWASEVAHGEALAAAYPGPPDQGCRFAAQIPASCWRGWIRKQRMAGHFAERLPAGDRPRVLRQIKHAAIYLPRRN